MLGESCPFDHGVDPLVVGPMLQWPMGGAQMGPTGVPPLGGWGTGVIDVGTSVEVLGVTS